MSNGCLAMHFRFRFYCSLARTRLSLASLSSCISYFATAIATAFELEFEYEFEYEYEFDLLPKSLVLVFVLVLLFLMEKLLQDYFFHLKDYHLYFILCFVHCCAAEVSVFVYVSICSELFIFKWFLLIFTSPVLQLLCLPVLPFSVSLS